MDNQFMALLKSKRIQWVVAGIGILAACLGIFSKPLTSVALKGIIHHRLTNLTYLFLDIDLIIKTGLW
jgi:hypothetical protein